MDDFKRDLILSIDTAIFATDTNDEYSVGIRNGLRWCKALLDDKEPQFEKVITKNRTTEFIHEVPTGHWIEPRKHGNWIYDEKAYRECDRCHTPVYLARNMRYCPFCGSQNYTDEEWENILINKPYLRYGWGYNMKPTEKQVEYAKYLAKRMCQELPKEYSKNTYSDFISKWRPIVKAEDDAMNAPSDWQWNYS